MMWKCKTCQSEIDVPEGTQMRFCPKCGAKADDEKVPIPAQTTKSTKDNNCPVCYTSINPDDETITCPDCNMVYHKDCWNDNNGCATYGCNSAGCLNPPPIVIDVDKGGDASASTARVHNGVRCPHCNTNLEAGATFCWSCGADLGGGGVVSTDAPLAGPWERWAARLIDFTLEAIVCGFFLGILFNLSDVPDAVVGIIVAPFAFLLDSAVYAAFGNTLGKWVWGIKTIESSGSKVSAGKFFYRNLRVYWGGYGLAIPIVTLCTFITQYNRVSKGTPSTYDEKMGLKSVRPNPSGLKSFLGVVLIILIFILIAVLNAASK